jgi:tRNA A-37 threonylcarbamoyl transferase component Bud32
MTIYKNLNGHSGCDVVLMRRENNFFVRKTSSTKEYNERLRRQFIKQELFYSNEIKVPKIFNSGFEDNLFFFDMEYVEGRSFFDFIKFESIQNIQNKFETILDFIRTNNYTSENIKSKIFDKIQKMKIEKKYDYYKNFCLDFDWQKIRKSYCHGDLTFENILISNEQIYFIDFLDSFVDTKMIDYSKILQETIGFWSYRKIPKNFNIKYMLLNEMLELNEFEKKSSIKLLVLNFLRIVPYADKNTSIFVEEVLNKITGRIK